MRKLTYLAIFEPSNTGYAVFYPDFPGCFSVGATLEEAMQQATEALGLHIYGMEKDGDEIPTATTAVNQEILTPGCLTVPITVFPDLVRNELDQKATKTNITLPAWLKELAEQEHVNYSKLMQTALIEYLKLTPSAQFLK